MASKSLKNFDKAKGILVIVVGLLILVILALIATYPRNRLASDRTAVASGVNISLGAIQYDFSSGRAVKRNDENITKLQKFLTEVANKDLSANCPSVYYNAVAASSDNRQVLLNYGCFMPAGRMFVVEQNNQWKILSPTNNFDVFGVPLCSNVNDNKIEATIAPVCVNKSPEIGVKPTYSIRS